MKLRKYFSLFLAVFMILSMTINVSAATSSNTVKTTGTMTLTLAANKTGSSNTVTFNFSSLPANAVVTKVEINTSSQTYSGGPISLTRLYVKNSTMSNWASATWNPSNKTTIVTGLIGNQARGTWSVYFEGINASSFNSGSRSIKTAQLTVYYNY